MIANASRIGALVLLGAVWLAHALAPPPRASAGATLTAMRARDLRGHITVTQTNGLVDAIVGVANPRFSLEPRLPLCAGMSVEHSALNDGTGHVAHFTPIAQINGVPLAVDPTRGACLSSAFGPREDHFHKGLDYYSANGGQIFAAAEGRVIEMNYRDDYGNEVLIAHGRGVFTRYAHLSRFAPGLAVGARVRAGDPIGRMGTSAREPVPMHLHYEVLSGNYHTPRKSFGLTPIDPLSLH